MQYQNIPTHAHSVSCDTQCLKRPTNTTSPSDRDDDIPFSQLIENQDHVTKKVRKNPKEDTTTRPVLIGLTLSNTSLSDQNLNTKETHSEYEAQQDKTDDKNSVYTPLISTAHHSLKFNSSDNDDMNDLIELSGEEFSLNKKRTCSEFLFSRKQSSACHTSEEDEQNYNELTSEIIRMLKGQGAQLASKLTRVHSTDQLFQVKCNMGHYFDTSYIKIRQLMRKFGYKQLQDISSSEESDSEVYYNYQQICSQCQPKLQQAQQYARQHKGILRSKAFCSQLEFQCQVGHIFVLSNKDYSRKWCQQCKKLVKMQFKEFLKNEEQKRQKEYEEKQKELYKEARQYYKKSYQEDSDSSDHSMNSYQNNNFHPDAQKVISAAKVVEDKLQIISQNRAQKYLDDLNQQEKEKIRLEEIVHVYKMLLFPEEVLKCFFDVLDSSQLKKQYREYARHIHPDKNNHPEASKAFQKLNKFYQSSLNKLKNQ